ncbi:MAG: type II toxin-antitoxin system RelE/ParE family toxin [Bacteroidetes bacterium]|nr:MAG: type II toxin-antitoxin system RelE/ParE family toxin [Bacteroidota bacterium]
MKSGVRLQVKFYRADSGDEPVRDWLRSLDDEAKKAIGEDIKTVQFGWPLGMPLVRKMEPGLWEVRTSLRTRIARVLFTVKDNRMVLLHGFIKKDRKTPQPDLNLARSRKRKLGG